MSRKASSSFARRSAPSPSEAMKSIAAGHAGERLVAHRAGLEAVAGGRLAPPGARDRPARPRSSSAAREAEALVRPEVLVRRAQQHVGVERLHVDAAMRGVVHAVHPGQRADASGRRRRARARRASCRRAFEASVNAHTFVRGPTTSSSAASSTCEVAVAHVRDAHDEIVILRAQQPRADVRVVVERRRRRSRRRARACGRTRARG